MQGIQYSLSFDQNIAHFFLSFWSIAAPRSARSTFANDPNLAQYSQSKRFGFFFGFDFHLDAKLTSTSAAAATSTSIRLATWRALVVRQLNDKVQEGRGTGASSAMHKQSNEQVSEGKGGFGWLFAVLFFWGFLLFFGVVFLCPTAHTKFCYSYDFVLLLLPLMLSLLLL